MFLTAYSASFAHVCASKTRGGAPYSITPGATRLSKLVGCALSLSVFCGSPHSACKICTLPASPAPRGPACRCRPSARSRTARTCRPARTGLPLRRAGHFPLRLQLQKNLVRTPVPASHHLRSTLCSSGSSRILVPRLSLSPGAAVVRKGSL